MRRGTLAAALAVLMVLAGANPAPAQKAPPPPTNSEYDKTDVANFYDRVDTSSRRVSERWQAFAKAPCHSQAELKDYRQWLQHGHDFVDDLIDDLHDLKKANMLTQAEYDAASAKLQDLKGSVTGQLLSVWAREDSCAPLTPSQTASPPPAATVTPQDDPYQQLTPSQTTSPPAPPPAAAAAPQDDPYQQLSPEPRLDGAKTAPAKNDTSQSSSGSVLQGGVVAGVGVTPPPLAKPNTSVVGVSPGAP